METAPGFGARKILAGAVRIARKAIGNPDLDQRLTADAQMAGLGIKGVHHPDGKVHILLPIAPMTR